MNRYKGTEKSPNGVYLNLSSGEFVQVNDAARVLPGDSEAKYIKVPSILAIVTGPFAGLLFILFLPFVGIIGFFGFLGYKLWRGTVTLERKTVRLVSFSWQPGKAYFSPRRRTPDTKPAKDKEELDELEEEIAKRKRDGEH
jgi:hypothetical protein